MEHAHLSSGEEVVIHVLDEEQYLQFFRRVRDSAANQARLLLIDLFTNATYTADRPAQSGVGLSQRKSWPHRLKSGSIHNIRI
jgi:hypothetical protein